MSQESNLPTTARQALFQRYREETPVGAWNETLALLLDHRSVRGYLSTPLPEGTVEALVAAASSAPTSSNTQAWSVIAVTDPDTRAKLSAVAHHQKHIVDAPLILVWIADLSRADRIGQATGQTLVGLDYTDAFLLAAIDAALAAQNAAVAAQSLGLGTVYIGALRNDPQQVADLLGLPPRSFAVVGLVVGHPDPAVPTAIKPRLPQAAVLHHETYSTDQTAAIARHDAATQAFRAEQGLPPQSWSQLIIARLGTVAALSGRDVLRAVLARLGFALK
ncbi:MAG TPA: nitroreductase family protein [Paenirhodobacter sp.]